MKVLITGTRTPVALDICRRLVSQGIEVFSADSMRYPMSAFSTYFRKHFYVPSPSKEPTKYINAIKEIIEQEHISLLLPTCEEVFYLSAFHETLKQSCQLFFDTFDKLKLLHDKFQFIQYARQFPILTPETFLIEGKQQLINFYDKAMVFKPVFSRFGDHALIKPSRKVLEKLEITKPYVAQEFIAGKEICMYCAAHHGKLLVHSIYHPKYKVGKGAGIYFNSFDADELVVFAKELIEALQFNGQISFDFIKTEQGYYVLECNPRATSGIHLIAEKLSWQQIFEGTAQKIVSHSKPKMVGFAMKTFGLKYLFSGNRRQYIKDLFLAEDVVLGDDLKWWWLKSFLPVFEIVGRMYSQKKNFKNASTDDIEYNGEFIG